MSSEADGAKTAVFPLNPYYEGVTYKELIEVVELLGGTVSVERTEQGQQLVVQKGSNNV